LIDIKGKPRKEYTHTHTSMMKDEPRKERRELVPFSKEKNRLNFQAAGWKLVR